MKKKHTKWKPIKPINRQLHDNRQDIDVRNESMRKLEHRLTKATGTDVEVIRDESLASMSKMLLDFAEPIMDVVDYDDRDAYEKAIQMSIVFWNASTMIEMTRISNKNIFRKALDLLKVRKLLKPFTRQKEIREITSLMISRKQELYPDVNRIIMGHEIVDTGSDYHLTVASTLQQ